VKPDKAKEAGVKRAVPLVMTADIAFAMDTEAINARDACGRNALFLAVMQGAPEIVDILLQRHAETDVHDHLGRTPLHEAVAQSNPLIIIHLLDFGADIDAPTRLKQTPLFFAVRFGFRDVVEMLLERGAQVNARDVYGRTPLHEAIDTENLRLVEILLRHHADPCVQNDRGEDALATAQAHGYAAIVAVLQRAMAGRARAPVTEPLPAQPAPEAPPPAEIPVMVTEEPPPPVAAPVETVDAPPSSPSLPAVSLDAVLDALPGSVYLLHPDGTYAYLSPAAARRLAVAPESCLGKPWNCVPLPPQAAVPFAVRRQEVISTGEAVSGGLRIVGEQGCRWYDYTVSPLCDAAGALAYVMVTLRENPARLALEEQLTRAHYALHETETKLSRARTAYELLERASQAARLADQAFHGAGVLLALLDANGHILRANHACEAASGQPERALRGEAFWAALVTPDEAARARDAFARALAAPPCACRLVLAGGDTSRRQVEWLLTTLTDADGAMTGVVCAGRISAVAEVETAPVLLLPEEEEEHRQSAA